MYKNKARIKSGPFIHKAGGVLFSFLPFYSPLGMVLHSDIKLSPLAGVTIPHTVLFKSVGTYLPLIGMLLHCLSDFQCVVQTKDAWGHTYRLQFRVSSTSCPLQSGGNVVSMHWQEIRFIISSLPFNLNGCFIWQQGGQSVCIDAVISGGKNWPKLNRRYVGNHVSSVSKVYK